MRTLYHYPLCPFSRKVRLMLAEKLLDFTAMIEEPWGGHKAFLDINPTGDVPYLVEPSGDHIGGSIAIVEYLEETCPDTPLLGKTLQESAEVRRLMEWFDIRFYSDVYQKLLYEKVLKRFWEARGPDSNAIRQGKKNIETHLLYITWLTDRRNWLAGDFFSLADATAAAHLSTLDYISEVPWEKYPEAKDWYVRIKSRPSFRALLNDRIAAFTPASHYANLDF
ncbi:MAG: glutathione S-transferase family protein [Holosporales bacterium]|nr:glutathione S-transferase family protein [Holosporales bacterium]